MHVIKVSIPVEGSSGESTTEWSTRDMPYYITIFEGRSPERAKALVALDDQALARSILRGVGRLADAPDSQKTVQPAPTAKTPATGERAVTP
jgi:hypothetical protein